MKNPSNRGAAGSNGPHPRSPWPVAARTYNTNCSSPPVAPGSGNNSKYRSLGSPWVKYPQSLTSCISRCLLVGLGCSTRRFAAGAAQPVAAKANPIAVMMLGRFMGRIIAVARAPADRYGPTTILADLAQPSRLLTFPNDPLVCYAHAP